MDSESRSSEERRDRPGPGGLGRKVTAGLAWSYLSYGTTFAAQAAGLVILARLLEPEDFGLFAIALIFAEVGRAAFGMGLGPALVQRKGAVEEFMDVAWTANFVLSSVVTLILAAIAPLVIDLVFRAPGALLPAWVLLSIVIVDGLRNPRNALLARRLDMKRQFWLVTPAACSRFLGSILAAWIQPSVWALVFGYCLGHVLGLMASYLVMPGRPRFRWNAEKFRQLYAFGGWLQLKNILKWSARNLDSVAVGGILGPVQLGFYNRAVALARLPQQQVTSVVDLVAFPMFSALQDGDPRRIRRAFKGNFDVACLTVFPILLAAVLFGEALVAVVLGQQWISATRAFQVLLAAVSVDALTQSFFPLLRGMGLSRYEFLLHGLKLLVVALLLYPATGKLGIEGAATAMAVGALATAPLALRTAAATASVRASDWAPTLAVCSLGLVPVWPLAWGGKRWLEGPVEQLLVLLPGALAAYLVALAAAHRLWRIGPLGSVLEALRRSSGGRRLLSFLRVDRPAAAAREGS